MATLEPLSPSLVQLQHVAKSFGPTRVLDRIDLEAREGDFVSLIGPSGCGKSTLLRLIAGLADPTEGTITIGGLSPREARPELFYLFQDPTLLPWRTVAANVELPLQLCRRPKPERRARVREMLSLVDLLAAAEQYPWQLSGGMKMRVSLARALSVAPRILLLDEPFGALDEMTRDRLNEDLLALRQNRPFTAFFVTHSVAEAVFLSTRVVVLASAPGRIAATIPIPFPFPRRKTLRESDAFLRLLAETSAALRGVQSEAGAPSAR